MKWSDVLYDACSFVTESANESLPRVPKERHALNAVLDRHVAHAVVPGTPKTIHREIVHWLIVCFEWRADAATADSYSFQLAAVRER
jgi:hypothetical protein